MNRTTRYRMIVVAALLTACAIPAFAELQNVEVGGSLRIRGNWYSAPAGPDRITAVRWAAQPGRQAVISPLFGWNDDAHNTDWVEQRTKLNVKADFTGSVSAFIELDSYDVWGEDFRSNYITGVDARAATADDVEAYQAYIEANDILGYPLRLRIGRQEMKFGSGWLVAPNDTAALFYGTSFDGIRATYATDAYSVDAFWSKLAERSPIEEDGDVDFYGVYASYLGIENITIDAYWLYLRDAAKRFDAQYPRVGEEIEDFLGVDDYDVTKLHTVGLRAGGTYGAFDFESELAYQFGDASAVGAAFAGAGLPTSPYGDDGADFSAWGGNLEVGYTFDMNYKPRIFLGAAYFDGEDNRDLSFIEWLGANLNPFWKPEASVSFNRLFSSWEYSEFIENTDFSNHWVARGGISAFPTEKLKLTLLAMHCEAVEAYERPWPSFRMFHQGFILLPAWSFLSKENSEDYGTELELIASYNYSDDLSFEAGWSHLFTGDGLDEGNFSNGNGLIFNGGTDNDDADYVYFETKLAF